MNQRVVAGRYGLIVELGRGATGVVWRAQDYVIDRPVAIKELHLPTGLPGAERQRMEARVLREVRTAGRLNDPATVTIHDVFVDDGSTYIVMELVDAANLAMLIDFHGPLDPTSVVEMAKQVLSALECAHKAGVVHRDIKPSNIMLTPDRKAKLSDFGIARMIDDPRLTKTGVMMGSPAYTSPEQLSGRDATPASDLWALGLTLAFAVEGVNPFECGNPAATMQAIMKEKPRLNRADGVLAEVITGLLAAHPRGRLSAGEARNMLAGFGETPTPEPTEPRRSVWRTVALIAACVAAAASLVVAGLVLPRTQTTTVQGAATTTATTTQTAAAAAVPPQAPAPQGAPLDGGKTATFGRGGEITSWELSGIQCGKGFLTPSGAAPTVVPCTSAHDIQLYSAATPLWDKKPPVPYPGVAWLENFGANFCRKEFAAKVTVNGKAEKLTYAVLIPAEQEWAAKTDTEPGYQEVLCVLWAQDRSPLTKSVVAG